jgi:hypothetical protein
MEKARFDYELDRIYKNYSFLWKIYNFHVKYFTRSYGKYNRGFIIGLENVLCKLIFEKETDSSVEPIKFFVGKKFSSFRPPDESYLAEDGWYPTAGLIFWLSGVQCERFKDVDQDLESVSQYTKIHMDKLLELFKDLDQFDGKLAYYRNLYKEDQITVEKIKAERARLHALGKDSSLEAAITNLRGGRK